MVFFTATGSLSGLEHEDTGKEEVVDEVFGGIAKPGLIGPRSPHGRF